MYRLIFFFTTVSFVAVIPKSHAETLGVKHWYRCHNLAGTVVLSDQISEQHILYGYDVLDARMQILEHVAPFDKKLYDEQKAKRDAREIQQQSLAKIRLLYSDTQDAEIAKRRQLDALDTSEGYNKLQLLRLKRQRAELIEDAASLERTGTALAHQAKENIVNLDKKIEQQNLVIEQQDHERTEIIKRFDTIIKKLTPSE